MKPLNAAFYQSYGKPLPSREDFHREYGGEITIRDFSTQYPNPLRLPKQFSAQRFNHSIRHAAASFPAEEIGDAYES